MLIAGGIGITPILSMARQLQAAGRPYALHYGARSEELMPYRTEIEAVAGAQARLYFDGGDPSRGMQLASMLGALQASRHVYVCGPRALIDATLTEAQQLGWPRSHIHFELAAPAATAADRSVTVRLARSAPARRACRHFHPGRADRRRLRSPVRLPARRMRHVRGAHAGRRGRPP